MTLTYSAASSADPDAAWALISRPDRWRRWAPHLRGAIGLGRPEVREGAVGLVLVGLAIPVPARIVDKQEGRSWTWRVGPLEVRHLVRPLRSGCEVVMELSAPAPLERVLAVSYGPVVSLLVGNLARVAERRPTVGG